jgi:hypothetical protein
VIVHDMTCFRPCGEKLVSIVVHVDADYDVITSQESTTDTFITQFVAEIASALGISPDRINVVSLSRVRA